MATEAGPDRLRRPDLPSHATFESLLDTWGWVRKRSLVPIEAVQPGDRQVVAAAYPRTRSRQSNMPVISLDPLATRPDVTSVVASTLVEAHRPLESVRELYLLHSTGLPDAATLRNLPHLESFYALHAGVQHPPLALDALPADTLRRLAVSRSCLTGYDMSSPGALDPIGRFRGLRTLVIDSCLPGDSVQALGALTELRHLQVRGDPGKGWKALRNCIALEEARLARFRATDLRGFSTWTRLRRLTISQRGLRSLAGIEALRALENLRLWSVRLDDLAPLRGHPRLQVLSLWDEKRIFDLSPLEGVSGLRRLEIGQIGLTEERHAVHITSLQPLTKCAELEELVLVGTVLDDGDLSPLTALPQLRRVKILKDYSRLDSAIAELRRTRPDVEVDYEGLGRTPGVEVGGVLIQPPSPGIDDWWIREDLAELLKASTNYAAEEKLRKALAAEDPALTKRLSFDTESGAVVIQATSEADIRAVAEVIGRLSASRPSGVSSK